MKIAAVLLSGFLALASTAKAQLANVHSVYVLPMGSGLDQHLANRITNAGLFQVVTDPKKADAVLADRIGTGLEERLAELYPEPQAPKPQPAPAKTGEEAKPETPPEIKLKEASAPPAAASGRSKGTIFLIDPRSRVVLWSLYEQPKDTSSAELDRTAGRIVARLQRDLKGK